MAIYDIDSINEAEYEASTDEILDNMLEACDSMIDALSESTAAQRHFGVTSKDMRKYVDSDPVANKVYGKKNLIGKMAVKTTAKNMNNIDKFNNVGAKAGKKVYKSITGEEASDDLMNFAKEYSKASNKGAAGALMSKAAKAGYDVKGEFDKAKAKAAKKKAIKETCLNILSVIDEL